MQKISVIAIQERVRCLWRVENYTGINDWMGGLGNRWMDYSPRKGMYIIGEREENDNKFSSGHDEGQYLSYPPEAIHPESVWKWGVEVQE